MDKKPELSKTHEDSVYYNLDADDDIARATNRLFKPEKEPLCHSFLRYFSCFSRSRSEDSLPEEADSYAEPRP